MSTPDNNTHVLTITGEDYMDDEEFDNYLGSFSNQPARQSLRWTGRQSSGHSILSRSHSLRASSSQQSTAVNTTSPATHSSSFLQRRYASEVQRQSSAKSRGEGSNGRPGRKSQADGQTSLSDTSHQTPSPPLNITQEDSLSDLQIATLYPDWVEAPTILSKGPARPQKQPSQRFRQSSSSQSVGVQNNRMRDNVSANSLANPGAPVVSVMSPATNLSALSDNLKLPTVNQNAPSTNHRQTQGTIHATCVICMDRTASQTVVPCGHLCLCEPCSLQFRDHVVSGHGCPCCRAEIIMIIPCIVP